MEQKNSSFVTKEKKQTNAYKTLQDEKNLMDEFYQNELQKNHENIQLLENQTKKYMKKNNEEKEIREIKKKKF